MLGWLDIATLVDTKNLDGSFMVNCNQKLPCLLHENLHLVLVPPVVDMPREVEIISIAKNNDFSATVKFAEILNIQDAQRLVGCHCLIQKNDVYEAIDFASSCNRIFIMGMPFVVDELIDWHVIDVYAGNIGRIVKIIANPAHYLLIVKMDDSSQVIIPLAEDFIVSVDDEATTLTMQLPKGILEI